MAAIQFRDGKLYFHVTGGTQPLRPLVLTPQGFVQAEIAEPAIPLDRNQRLVLSADRSQVGRVTYLTPEGRSQETLFELLKGVEVAWKVRVPGFADFSLSDDGSTVVETLRDIHVPKAGRLTVYDRDGRELGRRSETGIRRVEVSRDGTRIAVNTQENLRVLDRQSAILRDLGRASDFRQSPNGHTIAIWQRGQVIVAPEGQKPYSVPTDGAVRDTAFSGDGALLGIVDATQMQLLRVEGGQVLWSRKASNGAEFRGIDLSRDGSRIAVSQLTILQVPTDKTDGGATAEIELLDGHGNTILHQPFGLPHWRGGSPKINFLNATQVLIDGQKKYLFTPNSP